MMFSRFIENCKKDPTLVLVLAGCILAAVYAIFLASTDHANDLDPFYEGYIVLDEGWSIEDSSGSSEEIEGFPHIISYGTDGSYTLHGVLPQKPEMPEAAVFCFYTNYLDVAVYLDGERVYFWPQNEPVYSEANGNILHFIRLPAGYAGSRVDIALRGQLGDGITYQLNAPLLGAKASMVNDVVLEGMPFILVACFMLTMSALLVTIYFALKKRLALNNSIVCMAIFSAVFALYVLTETVYIRLLLPNSYAVYTATFMLLALLPAPLVAYFRADVDPKYHRWVSAAQWICFINLFAQMALHMADIENMRIMLTATHGVIVTVTSIMMVCLIKTDVRARFTQCIPMVVGGLADIALIWLNHPSLNNSMWFTIGVAVFVLLQFTDFVRSYLKMYRASVESDVLRDMAYHDTLTDIGNRNAYEHCLKALGQMPPQEGLCCLVADINDLKLINDQFGHVSGDAVIRAVGTALKEIVGPEGRSFRTGGDEFVVIIENFSAEGIAAIKDKLAGAAKDCGRELGLPLSLAIGCGQYEPEDGNIQDFIRRVDTLMYCDKKKKRCI